MHVFVLIGERFPRCHISIPDVVVVLNAIDIILFFSLLFALFDSVFSYVRLAYASFVCER